MGPIVGLTDVSIGPMGNKPSKGRYLYDVRTRRDEGGSGLVDEVREVA